MWQTFPQKILWQDDASSMMEVHICTPDWDRLGRTIVPTWIHEYPVDGQRVSGGFDGWGAYFSREEEVNQVTKAIEMAQNGQKVHIKKISTHE
jgi:regulator of RNase E activity RraB